MILNMFDIGKNLLFSISDATLSLLSEIGLADGFFTRLLSIALVFVIVVLFSLPTGILAKRSGSLLAQLASILNEKEYSDQTHTAYLLQSIFVRYKLNPIEIISTFILCNLLEFACYFSIGELLVRHNYFITCILPSFLTQAAVIQFFIFLFCARILSSIYEENSGFVYERLLELPVVVPTLVFVTVMRSLVASPTTFLISLFCGFMLNAGRVVVIQTVWSTYFAHKMPVIGK